MMECAELEAATTSQLPANWDALGSALQACPYTALVEFNTRHSRTLLTLAERSLEAGMAAAGAGGAGSSISSSRDGHSGNQGGEAGKGSPLLVAGQLAGCLAACLDGATQGGVSAIGTHTPEAVGEALFPCSCKALPSHSWCCCRLLPQEICLW
jgi:hypothetical protein